VLDLYLLRWRIEFAFKRLKSLIGLKKPPGTDERSAKPWVLAHLLMILLLELLVDPLEDSPTGLTPPDQTGRLARA
jgi:IS4 transposase